MNISAEYIEILKKEGSKAISICNHLNSESKFQSGMALLRSDKSSNVDYRAEHVLMRDIIKVYNEFASLNTDGVINSKKVNFILLFIYEILLGRDLSTMYDLKKLNELTLSNRFDNNIKIVLSTPYFEPKSEMRDEYILPAILRQINHEGLITITTFIIRVSSLIAKADGTISDKEEVLLKDIADKVNNPKVKVGNAQYNEVPVNDTLEIVLEELHQLIGLDEVKKSIDNLINYLKVQKIREDEGLKTTNNTLHAVFMGPPGTGKTTVARLLGRIYKHLGYLDKGHLVETDRAGMVAGYVGQTAIKADEIIKTAEDGLLFIDEAYSLYSGGFNDFGGEAIEILLKRMEDKRDNLVVVVAGYPDEMQDFIQSNPGLHSRFNRYFTFDHYSVDALLAIFKLYAKKADFALSEDAESKVLEIIERIYEKRHKGFGNARTMRNLFEKLIERQANRIVSITPITKDILITLTEEDVPEILKTVNEIIPFEEEDH